MGINIVFTLTGTDRVGLVDEITKQLLDLRINIETSRMTRLGGEFAMLMLLSLPEGQQDALVSTVSRLQASGFKVTTTPTAASEDQGHSDWCPYAIEVHGADHEGIVYNLAHRLAAKGISIEKMDTGNNRAPNSGIPLFTMQATILVPPGLMEKDWREELESAGHDQHVDILVRRLEDYQP